jgi:hypothetical protein
MKAMLKSILKEMDSISTAEKQQKQRIETKRILSILNPALREKAETWLAKDFLLPQYPEYNSASLERKQEFFDYVTGASINPPHTDNGCAEQAQMFFKHFFKVP